MPNLAYHKKKNGVVYVYSVESYWDKEKKAPRNKQKCIGKLDPQTGEILPNRKRAAPHNEIQPAVSTRTAGPFLLLEKLAEETGLRKLLKASFRNMHEEILSIVYFLVEKGLPLSRIEPWSIGHLHPFQAEISSQKVSKILASMTDKERQIFLTSWLRRMTESDYLCYDITSISSYVQGNEYVRRGYNRDGENLPQINLAVLFGQKKRLPAYYRRLQGNIPDVVTLRNTIKAMDLLGSGKTHFVLDRGFYSKANVDELLKRRYHFTMALPIGRKWVEQIIDLHYESIESPGGYVQTDDNEILYSATTLYKWGDDSRRTYVHIYYNPARAAEEFNRLLGHLFECKKELETVGCLSPHNEWAARFFILKETPKRGRSVVFNDSEILQYRKRYAGFFCILSTNLKDSLEALRVYRTRDVVENCFDDMKNQLDMKRLRVHNSSSMDSRLFLQFLASIFICAIRNTIQSDESLKNLTVRETLETMEPLCLSRFSDRYGKIYTETSPLQRNIMKAFGLQLPT